MKSVEDNSIFSLIKDKLSGTINSDSDKSVKLSIRKKSNLKDGELVPLFSPSSSHSSNSETEKVIPLFEERFEINKKMIKVAEIVISKRRVIEKKKVDIYIKREEVTIKYPDGNTEQL